MVRFRIKYQKVGAIRYASHRDLLRIFRRGFAAGAVPLCYSQGFNPHPRLSFGPSLRTGWEGLDEYMDLLLERPAGDLIARTNERLPEGLEVTACVELADSVPKLSADITAARYTVVIANEDFGSGARAAGSSGAEDTGSPVGGERHEDALHAIEDDLLDRFGRRTGTNGGGRDPLEPSLLDIKVSEKDGEVMIEYLSTMHQGKSLLPDMLECYLRGASTSDVPLKVVRTAMYVEREGDYHAPISKGVVQDSL